jgi:lipopolysaccharide/colanic/teichoic acid biosynthesis glycosyltransferase
MERPTVLDFSIQPITRQIQGNRTAYFACKRVMDLSMAILAHIALLPMLLCIAMLIKLDSPGPVLFVQKRVGARRRTKGAHSWWEPYTFDFYKFRTMRPHVDHDVHRRFMKAYIAGDEEMMRALQPDPKAATAFKLTGDSRITRVGRFLRKTSLDELPQLWNVIKGDMSLVGPRPPIAYEVEMYSPEHLQRLTTVPGITGLWQVSGRSELSFDDAVRMDLQYIEQQSIWLDVQIMLRTVSAVISGRGAG